MSSSGCRCKLLSGDTRGAETELGRLEKIVSSSAKVRKNDSCNIFGRDYEESRAMLLCERARLHLLKENEGSTEEPIEKLESAMKYYKEALRYDSHSAGMRNTRSMQISSG